MEHQQLLQETIAKMMTQGKGIVALDESTTTAGKRLLDIAVENTEDNRRIYRELYINAPGMQQYVSGVILYDETLRQSDRAGIPFKDTLHKNGVVIGIKVDEGLEVIENSPEEKVTKGLDGLDSRLAEYFELGARFAKWRAELYVSDTLPTDSVVQENMLRMAQYAQVCHQHGIVPVVEPEVFMEGAHSQSRAKEVTAHVLAMLIDTLKEQNVWLPGVVVKTSMVVPGSTSSEAMDARKIAADTVEVLQQTIPADIGGVIFLSGGQTTEEALRDLDAIADMEPLPFPVACSFGRALQKPALDVWQGKDENIQSAQQAFIEVLQKMSLADQGKL